MLEKLLNLATAKWQLVHSWYPPECCAEEHCHIIPCKDIIVKGYEYLYHGMTFFSNHIRVSPDGLCHACWSTIKDGSFHPFCIFIPLGIYCCRPWSLLFKIHI